MLLFTCSEKTQPNTLGWCASERSAWDSSASFPEYAGGWMPIWTTTEGFENMLVQDFAEGNILTVGHTTGFELGYPLSP